MARKMKDSMDKPRKGLAKTVFGLFESYYSQAGTRLNDYRDARRWLKGDINLVWSGKRRNWEPRVFPNLIESTVRQKVALLTDNKPKIYVYAIPQADLIDDEKHSELIKIHSQDMNMAFDHLWRFNKMQTVAEEIVFQGAAYGLMGGRCYWDRSAGFYGKGDIRTEPLYPGNIFFDESIHRIDLQDGSTQVLILAQLKPKTWFKHFFPDLDLSDTSKNEYQELDPGIESDLENVEDYPVYIEAYHPSSLDLDDDGDLRMKVTRMCGNKLIDTYDMNYFPVFIHPYELALEGPMGRGDIKRLKTLQKDFCSKVSQVSLNIALSASRQWIINPAKLGMGVDELIEHSGEAGYVFITKKLAEDVKNAIQAMDTPQFNVELFQYLYYLPQLIEWVSGLSKVMSGEATKAARQSKYEIGKQFEAATIRIRNVAHHIEMLFTDMGYIWTKMIKEHYKGPRAVFRLNEKTNKQDANIFNYPQNEDRSQMELEYILTVQPDSVLPIDIQSQAERDMNLAQMKMIDPQSLLEALNHPKSTQITQRLQAMAQQEAKMKGGQNPAAGGGTPGSGLPKVY